MACETGYLLIRIAMNVTGKYHTATSRGGLGAFICDHHVRGSTAVSTIIPSGGKNICRLWLGLFIKL